MCLIVDNDVAHKVFIRENDPDFGDLHRALFGISKQNVIIMYGGKLGREYAMSGRVRLAIIQLDRAGKAKKFSDRAVDHETNVVRQQNVCVSDDEHIIALARVSSTRLLCSHDNELHRDFTNPVILNNPRGKVYQCKGHKKLLKSHCG